MSAEEEDIIDEQQEETNIIEIDNLELYNRGNIYKKLTNDRKKTLTTSNMTKFELARFLGVRIKQLSAMAPPLVDISKMKVKDPKLIALKELDEGKLPIIVGRTLPNGHREIIPVNQLIIPPRLYQSAR